MDERDRKVLERIYQHIQSVLAYCEECNSLDEFEEDTMRVEATVFNFLQIGELAKAKLSDDAKNKMSDIPWKYIYGMRNRIVHRYEGVDMRIVWDTVQEDFPTLKEAIEKNLSLSEDEE